MRKLILHIGSHKTGTSSIQEFLLSEHNNLKSLGWYLYANNPNGSLNKEGNCNYWIQDSGTLENFTPTLLPGFVKAISDTKSDNVIVSTEHLFWFYNTEILRIFTDRLLKKFDTIKVIIYLRRQDRQLISQYQQAAKYTTTPEAKFYGHQAIAMPSYKPYFDRYLNYYKKILMWIDLVGNENTTVRVFENEKLFNNNVIDDFLKTSDIFLTPKNFRSKVSRGRISTLLGHNMNRLKSSTSMHFYVHSHLNDNSNKLLPSREQAQHLYQEYEESNQMLSSLLNLENIFNDNFDDYPDFENNDWDNESSLIAIEGLIYSLNSLEQLIPSPLEISALINIATTLEKNNLEQAITLMRIAQKLRPHSEFIKQKLNEWEK